MDGFVKLLYVNLPFGKQLIPQLLYIKDRVWRPVSLLPTTPSRISETKTHTSIFFETEFNSPCLITIDSHEHKCLRLFKDGSGLYECRIDKLENLPIGSSFRHSDFRLNLFHHTSLDTVPKILKSGELWASKSNYEGSVHHDEKNFIYLTGVEKLENHDDLVKVAMVNKGRKIALRYDQAELGIESLVVPERNMEIMNGSIELYVEPDLIEPQPMLYHDSSYYDGGVTRYWELFHKHIFRIPVSPGGSVSVNEQKQLIDASHVTGLQQTFRILAGCAFEKGMMRLIFDEDINDGLQVTYKSGIDKDPVERFFM